jgi:CheY-like chemotaxis protein
MRFKKQRILIVDDNNDILDILSEFLLIQGLEAECAGNGVEALSLFSEYHFDAVLTDFQMPCMNGINLAHEIRKKEPQTLIIMMTSDTWMSVQENDFIDYVVEKPFRLKEIHSILQGALESKEHAVNPQI